VRVIRLNNVDFPAFGRPTMVTTGFMESFKFYR